MVMQDQENEQAVLGEKRRYCGLLKVSAGDRGRWPKGEGREAS